MIKGLDGLRAIAFFLVFLFHLNALPFGWTGVQFFFVLSGFLITPILVKLKDNHPNGYYRHFITRRAFRIFPLYYFYLLLALLSVLIGYAVSSNVIDGLHVTTNTFLCAFGYVYNFYRIPSSFIDFHPFDHLWSLSVEEQFYLIWPFLVLLTRKEYLKRVLILMVAMGPVVRFFSLMFFQHHFSTELQDKATVTAYSSRAIYMLPWSHFDAFAIGALFSMIEVRNAKSQFYLLLFMVPVAGFVGQYIYRSYINPFSLGYFLDLKGAYKSVWGYSLLNYLFAVAIYRVAREHVWLNFLEKPAIKKLGKISYGAYIYHYPCIQLFTFALWRIFGKGSIPVWAVLLGAVAAFGLTVAVSLASFQYIESPFLRYRERLFQSNSTRVAFSESSHG